MNTPLVTVICLCHNQQKYVGAAIRSVLTQTYENIELIVVDDASTDGSQQEIESAIKDTNAKFISISEIRGNCAAFNQGFHMSKGQFIIDLAADDLLLPKRIEEGINDFANANKEVGVHFSDAFLINENGDIARTFYKRDIDGQLINSPASGDVFESLIRSYFICAPTMMIKREVLDELNGYDEALTYEDFDFWIRSSRNFKYHFNAAPLVKKRDVPNSLGKTQFALRSKHLQTTFKVCNKALDLCRNEQEYLALISRCKYEIKQCVKTLNLGLISKYRHLIKQCHRRLSSLSNMDK